MNSILNSLHTLLNEVTDSPYTETQKNMLQQMKDDLYAIFQDQMINRKITLILILKNKENKQNKLRALISYIQSKSSSSSSMSSHSFPSSSFSLSFFAILERKIKILNSFIFLKFGSFILFSFFIS